MRKTAVELQFVHDLSALIIGWQPITKAVQQLGNKRPDYHRSEAI